MAQDTNSLYRKCIDVSLRVARSAKDLGFEVIKNPTPRTVVELRPRVSCVSFVPVVGNGAKRDCPKIYSTHGATMSQFSRNEYAPDWTEEI